MSSPIRGIVCSALVLAAAEGAEVPLGTLVRDGGAVPRVDTPVAFACPLKQLVGRKLTAAQLAKGALTLVEKGAEGQRLPAQWDPAADLEPASGAGALVFVLKGTTPPKTRRTFALVYSQTPAASPLAIEDAEKKHLVFSLRGKRVLRYNYGVVPNPAAKGKPSPYDRPCYIHPAWTPAGTIVTDDFPRDHYHQRGIFFAWVKTQIGTLHPDFWNLGSRTGRTTLDKLAGVGAGPVIASAISHNVLRAPEEPVIRELFIIRLWATAGDHRLFDVLVRHEPVDAKVVLKKYFYGGMAFRGAREWLDRKKVHMLTSEGNDRTKGNFKASSWVDVFGTIGGAEAGAVMFSHPANPRHPQPNRLHPKIPYAGYIPAQKADLVIDKGTSLKLRYRFLLYDGKPDAERNRRIAKDMAEPPAIEWRPAG